MITGKEGEVMILSVCVDDKGGMLFNRRRQSRDRRQQEDLVRWCTGRKLWVNSYSAPLFEGAQICVAEDFLEQAGAGEICFAENQPVAAFAEKIEAVVLYRWNRTYPADLWFDLDMTDFTLAETTEFSGLSHETITREIYERKERASWQ